jgi:hypothetical protein
MQDCCDQPADGGRYPCPGCGRHGHQVDRITLKALLRPDALVRLASGDYRFCATSECPVVYHGPDGEFRREDVLVPVFQKEVGASRTLCYCFVIAEDQIRREVETSGFSASADRIKDLVVAGRCACEVRNPQGTCCLGNVFALVKAAGAFTLAPAPNDLVSASAPE